MPLEYTEISKKRISRGTNVNVATIPARRCVGFGVPSATVGDPIDIMSVATAAKFKGITAKSIASGECGDVHTEGVVPVESDGSGTIAAGQWLTVNVTAGATEGRVFVAAPSAGANAQIIGKAMSAAAAVAGAVVMVDLNPSVMQG
jgi:hypothetical protein